ncbi:MAG: DIE2/ALG10 family-domain-containing protein [Monoraphidium minutum]|nr:MAG: DIE2/ALG10 family-domain-containing protein [Monoraphidium minutum]
MAAASPRHPPAWLPAVWSIALLAALLVLVTVVNHYVPEPYMDEPFHVPATQRYCAGDFGTWDPKITTFPGLYVIGAAYAWAARLAAGWAGASVGALCSTPYLRSANALLALASAQLLSAVGYELQRAAWLRQRRRALAAQRRPGRGRPARGRPQQQEGDEGGGAPGADEDAEMRRGAARFALVASLLPTQLLYAALYYTDVAALTGLLVAQLLLLRGGRGGGAAAAAAAAVGMRQTNAVWVTLMIGGALLEDVLAARPRGSGGGGTRGKAAAGGSGGSGSGGEEQEEQEQAGGGEPESLLGELRAALPAAWRERRPLLAAYWQLLLVPAAFAAFVVLNGGVTVGDREAHAPVSHLAQPLYFGLFALAAAGPLLAAPGAGGGAAGWLADAAAAPRREAAGWLAAAALAAAAVARGTLAHPYLLADNRHYTFYAWRRVVGAHPAARYALIPAELLGWRLLLRALAAAQRRLWVAAYAAAVVVTLLPAWLLEPRYFTPGLLLGLLHAWAPAAAAAAAVEAGRASGGGGGGRRPWGARADAAALLLTGAGYAAVNAATLYVFCARPYVWGDGSTARFMWGGA